MTKKPLIAGLAMLGLLILATLFWYQHENNASSVQADKLPLNTSDSNLHTLRFATENLPLADERVQWSMQRALNKVHFKRLRTYKLHQKAKKMFPVITPILNRYGIPEDFKYIPLVESGLHSGTSHKGASGTWQFMPHTARAFGLTVNAQVDERQHLEKSTLAAAKYLRVLYKEFKNWTLVAAAYNIGGNKLKRILRNQDHDNYFKLKLNRETATYVYKLVAMKEIIENPKRYGYRKAEVPYYYTINLQHSRYYPESFLRGGIVLKHAPLD